jgi:hypothetical protein
MKKFAIVLIFLAANIKVYSQDTIHRVNEIGIGFTSLTSFSLRYQWGKDNFVYRITAVSLGGTNSTANTNYTSTSTTLINTSSVSPSIVNTPINLSGGLNFSVANIKPVSKKFGLMFGAEVGVNLSYVKSNTDNIFAYKPLGNPPLSPYSTEAITASYSPFLGLVIGARYKFSQSFYLYAEITPNINYTYAKASITNTPGVGTPVNTNKITNTYGISGLANSGAMITIIYRIKG